MSTEPLWIQEARKHVGLKEIPGPQNNATIANWLQRLKAWWTDDETPWCGVFVAHCIEASGLTLPKNWMRAKAWAEWGSSLSCPVHGCVVVFERVGGGHVGFVVGCNAAGHLMVLGGNQGNAVSIAAFDRARVVACRWPASLPVPAAVPLTMLAGSGALSTNEA